MSPSRRLATAAPAPVADRTWWVAAAAFLVFGASIFSGFHFDDYGMLRDRAVLSASGWSWWQTRPLTWASFWLNYAAVGRNPVLWHTVNVALHVACSALLYRVVAKFSRRDVALIAALLFAVHPIQSEAVDCVYARAILLSAIFSLLAIDRWLSERLWQAVLCFALAVLAKEECVAVPLVLAFYGLRGRIAPVVAMLAIALAAGMRVIAAIHISGMKNIGTHAGISPLAYLSEQGIAILRYFGLLIVPVFFTVDPQLPEPAWILRIAAWMLVIALVVVASRRMRRTPAAFWLLAGVILLLPSSSIFAAADLAADRRMYLPMLAFAPAITLLLPRSPWRFAAIAVLALISLDRTYIWASDRRLWSEAVALAPAKVRPRIQLARALPPDEALPILIEAERLAPEDPAPPAELARVNLEMNRPADALAHAGRALALAPRDPGALSNRGTVLLALGQTTAARRDFVASLLLDACLEEARSNLAHSGGIPTGIPMCRRF